MIISLKAKLKNHTVGHTNIKTQRKSTFEEAELYTHLKDLNIEKLRISNIVPKYSR